MGKLKAPFPWQGGKSIIAGEVWKRFGVVKNYVEPFAGSLAVLLAREDWEGKTETVNDVNCYLCNFWRALQAEPGEVARYADWPVNEADLYARKMWLLARKEELQRVKEDVEWFDAQAAGYWVYGVGLAILDDWTNLRASKRSTIPHLGDAGMGIHRSTIQHLGSPGVGVHRKGNGSGVGEYLQLLSRRLRRVRVCCGDWKRVLTPAVTTRHGTTAVFLDPPYDGYGEVYGNGGFDFRAVWDWAMENGGNREFRIALCGYDLPEVDGWELLKWKANGGYAQGEKKEDRKRERILFSPGCLRDSQGSLLSEERKGVRG